MNSWEISPSSKLHFFSHSNQCMLHLCSSRNNSNEETISVNNSAFSILYLCWRLKNTTRMRSRTAVIDSRSGIQLQQKRQENVWGPNQSVCQKKSKYTFSGWPLCSTTLVLWTNTLHVNSSKLQICWTRHLIFLEPNQRNKGLTFKGLRIN